MKFNSIEITQVMAQAASQLNTNLLLLLVK